MASRSLGKVVDWADPTSHKRKAGRRGAPPEMAWFRPSGPTSEREPYGIREATKQVSRARMPSFSEPMIFDAIITHAIQKGRSVIVLHESAEQDDHLSKVLSGMSDMPITIFIGPEGGFTEDEIGKAKQQGAAIASLGSRRLRAETAAIAAVSLTCLQR